MSSGLLIMKFGGTSVGSAERIAAACDLIAQARRERPVVAVVSAMSKVTDALLDTIRHAEAGDRARPEPKIRQLEERHLQAGQTLFPPPRAAAPLTAGRP